MYSSLASSVVATVDTLPLSRELVLLLLVIVSIALGVRTKYHHHSDLPVINKPGFWTWNRKPYVQRFAFKIEELLNEGFRVSTYMQTEEEELSRASTERESIYALYRCRASSHPGP
jgi:type II secretory pathway component PulF